jgi:RNA polymerase sigma factor (sigma-70 family)
MAHGQTDTILGHLYQLVATGGEATDRELLQCFLAGRDEGAFTELLRRHGPLIWAVCRRALGDFHEAEDAFQATFLVLARRAGFIRKGEAVGSWLYGVARRTAMNAKKTSGRRKKRERRAQARPPEQPATEVSLRELQALLDEEVGHLPAKHRAPFVLCCLEGRSKAEAARELGWKEGTLSSRLAEARKRLQQRLARRGVTLSAALCTTALAAAAPPVALAWATARGVLLSLTGQAAGTLSARAVLLAGGVMKGLGAKLKVGALLALALGPLAVGVGLLAAPAPDAKPEAKAAAAPPAVEKPRQNRPPEDQRAKTDRYGDPLPPGAIARLGTVRLRPGSTDLLAYRPGGKRLLTVSHAEQGPSICLWEVATGKPFRRFEAGGDWLRRAALSPDAKTLAIAECEQGQRQERVALWDVASGKPVRAPLVLGTQTFAVVFAPDGKALATAGEDQIVRLWDLATGAERLRFQGTQDLWVRLAFSPDGKTLAAAGGGRVVPLWDVNSGKQLHSLDGPQAGYGKALAFSPDGKALAAGAHNDPEIRLWDPGTGRELRRLRGGRGTQSLFFSPDGKTLAWGDAREEGDTMPGSPVRLWDWATGRELRQLQGHRLGVVALAFSPDGCNLAAAGTGSIRLWAVATGKELVPFLEPESCVASVAFSPDGRVLATGGLDGTIRLWEASSGRLVRLVEGGPREYVWRVRFSPDGRTLASAGEDGTARLWDPATGREVRRLQGHQGGVLCVNFAPDGRTLVTCGRDNTVRLWEAATGKELRRLAGGPGVSSSGFVSPDGRLLTAVRVNPNGDDCQVFLWDAATGKELRRWPQPRLGAIAFSPDSRTLAGVEQAPSGEVPRTLYLWDVATGKVRAFPTSPGHRVFSVVFSPDGRTVAWGDVGGTITLWEVASAKVRCRLERHHSYVGDLAFSPDSRLLVSASADTTALVWAPAELARRTGPLTPGDREALWADLAGADATRAYQAVATLAGSPAEALPLLREKLKPAAAVDRRRATRLIGELESDGFSVREKAMKELAQLGDTAEVALREASAARPALELRRRLDHLLEKLQSPVTAPDRLQQLRAVEVLESIGSPEARHLLQALTEGAPEARLTREAKAALARMAKRAAAVP